MFFAGLQLAVIFSLTGAVVAEFATGGNGLGYRLQSLATEFDQPGVIACLVLLTLIGLVFYTLVHIVERHVSFWAVERSDSGVRP